MTGVGKLGSLAAVAAALALVAGCGHTRRTEPFAPPLRFASQEMARGEKVFFQHCHSCHPHGAAGLGPAFNNKPLPVFLMKLQVRRGLGVMPAFDESQISRDDLDALMAYIVALRRNKPEAAALRRS
jgi:mono/diheme cytochrome c family protein